MVLLKVIILQKQDSKILSLKKPLHRASVTFPKRFCTLKGTLIMEKKMTDSWNS